MRKWHKLPNFVMKLGISNPWYVYFPKIKQKVEKVTKKIFVKKVKNQHLKENSDIQKLKVRTIL